MITNYEILQTIIAENEFINRIPELTRENIATVGNALIEYDVDKNIFLNALVNKIGLTLITSDTFDNIFTKFHSPELTYGDCIEDIFVQLTTGENFDPSDENPFAKNSPTIDVIYHKEDRKIVYTITISDSQLKSAFTSPSGLENLITALMGSLNTSLEYDDFVMTKKLISDEKNYGKVISLPLNEEGVEYDSAEFHKRLLKEIKLQSMQMSFMRDDCNALKVKTNTPLKYQTLFIKGENKLEIDMEVLAGIFNLSKSEIENEIIIIDDFIVSDTNTVIPVACLIDSRAFKIVPTLKITKSQENGKALYTNFFLHYWQIQSISLFRNMVMFGYPVPTEEI